MRRPLCSSSSESGDAEKLETGKYLSCPMVSPDSLCQPEDWDCSFWSQSQSSLGDMLTRLWNSLVVVRGCIGVFRRYLTGLQCLCL